MADTEEELVRRAARGDREVLAELFRRVGPLVRPGIASAIPKRWQSLITVDDVMQQTYTDAFLNIHRFEPRGEGSLAAWLTTLARRNLRDALKMLERDKRGGDRRGLSLEAPIDSCVALYDLLTGSGTSPSRAAAKDEATSALNQAIAGLPPTYAQVVRLYDIEGKPVEEVAHAVSRSPGAIYMLRARAHDRLRELMGSPSRYLSGSG